MGTDLIAKEAAASKALEWVKPGMVIGLGTGSTVYFFLQKLGALCQKGLRITAFPSSLETEKLAKQLAIPLTHDPSLTEVDLTIDGADEIDGQKKMIKGAGGALVREKILAHMSREMIVIVDSSKKVVKLGKKPLPVEIIPFAAKATQKTLLDLGFQGNWRQTADKKPYLTDNGNFILDIHFKNLRDDPEKDEALMTSIPGVVDTGFFFHLADRCLIGYADKQVEVWN